MGALAHSGAAGWLSVLAVLWALPLGVATTVRVVGRQLIVDGRPIHLKGVCWNPVPKGGVHPKDLDFRGFVAADAELMARAGINAVRTYEPITDFDVLDILWKKRIYVLNTVYIWGKAPIESVIKKVSAAKSHPAVLMWVVGNEWNYNGLYVGLPFPQALEKVAQAVKFIKATDSSHPVATVHGEIPNAQTLATLHEVDIWGINKYSGLSFGDLFAAWSKLSTAPMFLGEYGADAYNTKTSQRDEMSQAKATTILTGEIVSASSVHAGGVCIGGIIFEFADEWWKDGSGNPSKHDVGGVSPGGGPYPDMTFNEEWWGLVKYDGTPREAFRAYANVQVPGCALPSPTMLAGAFQLSSIRLKSCGAHPACTGKLGMCCPSEDGVFNPCCNSRATTPPPSSALPSTTWIPPMPHEHMFGSGGGGHVYEEHSGKFANGHFKVGTAGCSGVGECQFKTRTAAQAFCDSQPKCTAVLLHPFEDDCAGGYGCYTPRYGMISTNNLWDRSGGKAWIKGTAGAPPQVGFHQASTAGHQRFAFVGYARGTEAEAACKPYGRLAMPKTAGDQASLRGAMDAAQAAGKMSKKWPNNTIWLGGYWQEGGWQWNDGTPMTSFNWADGQPSAGRQGHQSTEPWLCMILDGHMHDSDPQYAFGIMCELDKPVPAPAAAPAAAALPPPPPPPPPPTTTPKPPPAPSPVFVEPPAAKEAPAYPEVTVRGPAPESESRPFIPVDTIPRGDNPYQFVGFAGPAEARKACGAHRRLAMPKTRGDQRLLLEAVKASLFNRQMSKTWPENTIWLGGQWSARNERWEWDDGTTISHLNWADGQPSSVDDQKREPWLCMVSDGDVHDSDPPFSFGVMCEDGEPGSLALSMPAAVERVPPVAPPARKEPRAVPYAPATATVQVNVAPQHRPGSKYMFVGYTSPGKARTACGEHWRLAMPKTQRDQQELLLAVRAAIDSREMSHKWPKNTIWLGGHWNGGSERWEWDDGTEASLVNWADGQPSASQKPGGNQAKEPWLCMVADGHVHDSDPPYKFGIMCERGEVGRAPLVRGMLDTAPITWVLGRNGANCHETCQGRGGCSEGAWPHSAQDFKDVVLAQTEHRCSQVQDGGQRYDPSASGIHCAWQGPLAPSAWLWKRCAPPAPRDARRFCPCGGDGSSAAASSPIWS